MNYSKTAFLIVFMVFGIFSQAGLAQEKTITGQILDENGEPFPLVSILIKGTTRGTTSDPDGFFRITVNPGDLLHRATGEEHIRGLHLTFQDAG